MADCEDIIREALFKYNMSKSDVDEFKRAANALWRRIKAENRGTVLEPELQAAADRWAEKEKLAAIAKKRQTYLQLSRQFQVMKFCLDNFVGMQAEGLKALLGDSKYNMR